MEKNPTIVNFPVKSIEFGDLLSEEVNLAIFYWDFYQMICWYFFIRLFIDWWLDFFWLIDGFMEWWSIIFLIPKNWLIEWLIDWLNYWITDWLTGWMTDWLTDCLTDCLTDWLTKFLIDCKDCSKQGTSGLIGWLIEWFSDWLQESYKIPDWFNWCFIDEWLRLTHWCNLLSADGLIN